jgi:HSP20 family protein
MAWPSLRPFSRGSDPTVRGREGDPFSSLFRQVEDLFEDFSRSYSAPATREGMALSPRVDVSETDSELRIKAELPGVEEKDVEVVLAAGVLTIKGEKRQEKEEKKEDYHVVERSYGSFARSFRLPFDVNADQVHATFDKGILTVSLPKPPEAKEQVRKIAVTKGG